MKSIENSVETKFETLYPDFGIDVGVDLSDTDIPEIQTEGVNFRINISEKASRNHANETQIKSVETLYPDFSVDISLDTMEQSKIQITTTETIEPLYPEFGIDVEDQQKISIYKVNETTVNQKTLEPDFSVDFGTDLSEATKLKIKETSDTLIPEFGIDIVDGKVSKNKVKETVVNSLDVTVDEIKDNRLDTTTIKNIQPRKLDNSNRFVPITTKSTVRPQTVVRKHTTTTPVFNLINPFFRHNPYFDFIHNACKKAVKMLNRKFLLPPRPTPHYFYGFQHPGVFNNYIL